MKFYRYGNANKPPLFIRLRSGSKVQRSEKWINEAHVGGFKKELNELLAQSSYIIRGMAILSLSSDSGGRTATNQALPA